MLNFLALVFGSHNADIFHLINEKTQLEMLNAYQNNENMTRSGEKNFQDNNSSSMGQNFDAKSIIIKKKNLTSSGMSKKRMRNNSSSSFKSNPSSTSNIMENSVKN